MFSVIIMLAACDQDSFQLRDRQVIGEYQLQQWEDSNTFYLVESGEEDEGGGDIGGTVIRIGWNDRYIIAERKATFGGDGDGWMIIDTRTELMFGPFSDAELADRMEVHGVSIISASPDFSP